MAHYDVERGIATTITNSDVHRQFLLINRPPRGNNLKLTIAEAVSKHGNYTVTLMETENGRDLLDLYCHGGKVSKETQHRDLLLPAWKKMSHTLQPSKLIQSGSGRSRLTLQPIMAADCMVFKPHGSEETQEFQWRENLTQNGPAKIDKPQAYLDDGSIIVVEVKTTKHNASSFLEHITTDKAERKQKSDFVIQNIHGNSVTPEETNWILIKHQENELFPLAADKGNRHGGMVNSSEPPVIHNNIHHHRSEGTTLPTLDIDSSNQLVFRGLRDEDGWCNRQTFMFCFLMPFCLLILVGIIAFIILFMIKLTRSQ